MLLLYFIAVSMLFFLLDSIAIVLPAGYVAYRCFPQHILKALLFAFAIVLSLITIVELMLGGLAILNNGTLLGGSILAGGLLVWIRVSFLKPLPQESIEQSSSISQRKLNKKGLIALAFLGTAGSIPVQAFLIEYGFQLHRIHPLTSWDVVTYHLPNAIDYLQTGSLWTMRGSFSQYPGGNELLNIWSFLSLKTDALLGLSNLSFNAIIILVLLLCLRELSVFRMAFYYWLSLSVIIITFFIQPDYQRIIFSFGQNDLPLAIVEILATWILIEALKSPKTITYWVVFAMMLGTGIGIKPNGIYYFIGFLILTIYALIQSKRVDFPTIFKTSFLISIVSGLVGGFWYVRNLIKLGTLFESSILEAGFPGAIVNNLLNPDLYVLDDTNLTIVSMIGINLMGWIILWLSPSLKKTPFNILLSFNVIAFLSFIFTPHSAGFWAGGQWIFKTQLRYGITLIPITIVIGIVVFTQLIRRIVPVAVQSRWEQWVLTLHQKPTEIIANTSTIVQPLIIKVMASIIAVGLAQSLTYTYPLGLPNFEAVIFVRNAESPLSRVYMWVQENIVDQSIYTIGLRPYGLYNMPFSNRVIYGGDSDQWTYENALTIVQNDRPDFLALGRNPFNGQFPIALREMLNHPEQFEVVYGDQLAVVFKTNLVRGTTGTTSKNTETSYYFSFSEPADPALS